MYADVFPFEKHTTVDAACSHQVDRRFCDDGFMLQLCQFRSRTIGFAQCGGQLFFHRHGMYCVSHPHGQFLDDQRLSEGIGACFMGHSTF